MQYILLLITIIFNSAQQIIQKQYNTKEKEPAPFLFLVVNMATAMIFFVLSSGFKLNFTSEIIPHSIAFSISYIMGFVGNIIAIGCGSLAITALVISYSLVLPMLYGAIFLHEKISAAGFAGIAMLLISILLLNLKKEKLEFSPKWLLFVAIAFVGNGLCTIIQKNQQLCFDGNFKSEFMILALAIATLVMLIFAIARKETKRISALCLSTGALNGACNGAVNLLVMILGGILPNSVLFPSISAGGIAISFVLAILIYKEKLSKLQFVGYIMGIASVILLNL